MGTNRMFKYLKIVLLPEQQVEISIFLNRSTYSSVIIEKFLDGDLWNGLENVYWLRFNKSNVWKFSVSYLGPKIFSLFECCQKSLHYGFLILIAIHIQWMMFDGICSSKYGTSETY